MITKKEIQHIAKLARLGLTEKEGEEDKSSSSTRASARRERRDDKVSSPALRLARAIEKHQKEFSRILDYIEKLKEVDTAKVESSRFILRRENVTRKDEAQEGIRSEIRRKLLKLAPETKDGYLKTKPILYLIRD